MATDPYAGLSPEEKKAFGIAQPSPSPTAPAAPSVPVSNPMSGLSPAEQQRFTALPPAATPPPSPPGVPTPPPGHDLATALVGGVATGLANVVNSPSSWFGWNQLVPMKADPSSGMSTPAFLSDDDRAALAAHPWIAKGGQIFGQAVGAAPVAAPLAGLAAGGATALGAGNILAGTAAGAAGGAAQNLLTSSEAPQENLLRRGLTGAVLGAPFGAAGGALERSFGAGAAITPEVQQAGNMAKNAGIDVLPENLPRVGGQGLATGASANTNQVAQVNQAFGGILGENTPNFAPKTLDPMLSKLGQNVGNAANAGQISYNSVEPALVKIGANTTDPRVHRLLNDVLNEVDASGSIPGDKFQNLIRHGSDLDLAQRSRSADLAEPAQAIETALTQGFGQSSQPGVAAAYSQAREAYKLGLAIEDNVKTAGTSQINPATMLGTMTKWFPDAPTLGTGGRLADQFANLSRSTRTLFGGGGVAPPAGTSGVPSPWHDPVTQFLFKTVPETVGYLGHRFQTSPSFATNLLMRGSQPPASWLPALGAPAGVAAVPNQLIPP